MNEEIVAAKLGEAGIRDIAAKFYAEMREDDVIGHFYPEDDWEGAEKRLADFLLFRLGISDRYILERGHPRLRMRHMGFPIREAERDRWIEIMSSAMDEVGVSGEVRVWLDRFFAQTADFMRNRPG